MTPNFEAFNKAMAPYHQIMKNVELVNKFVLPQQLQINAAIASMAKFAIDHHLRPVVEKLKGFENFADRLQELFENVPESFLLLANYGWYAELDHNLPYYEYLGSLIKEDRIEELDNHLSKYYREHADRIFKSLSKSHPDRSKLFDEIESTYNNKLYSACITLALSQVDGISKDTFNRPFFLTDNDLPKIKKNIDKASLSTVDLIAAPLINKTPIMAGEKDLNNYPIQLNRHSIMHGSDKSYGTEINCLKCISFLKYFSDAMDHIKN